MAKPTAVADPMLQGTYQQDDSRDFEDSSRALDDFERQLATGTATHSPQKCTRPAQPRVKGPAGVKPAAHGSQPPPMRPSFAVDGHKGGNGRRVSEEQQAEQLERDEEVAEVRRLGGGDDGDDSD